MATILRMSMKVIRSVLFHKFLSVPRNLKKYITCLLYHASNKVHQFEKEIKLLMSENTPVYVWGDEFKTGEVVSNYLSNAIHHCEGDKIIDIRFSQRDGKVRVTFFNTGRPIPEESISHIWEKFYKVDKARTREYGGSGIGLSIVKAIMESMNQEYGVENYTNGVAFWFEMEMQERIAEHVE